MFTIYKLNKREREKRRRKSEKEKAREEREILKREGDICN